MESHDETGCQAPECPMPCVNNCGFFGRAATMNMCSKCYKDTLLNQEQANLAASSIGSIISGNSSGNGKDPIVTDSIDISAGQVEANKISAVPSTGLLSNKTSEGEGKGKGKGKDGPSRCNTCRRRVGLTGFHCKCGNLFCSAHRYSDKHDCPFDYRTTAQDAISKANPVVKADKLDKI